MRLAALISHPVQYYAPIFRELARRCDLHVFYSHRMTPDQHSQAGFGVPFEWDVDLSQGYEHTFLHNVARNPGCDAFFGCDTPEIHTRLSAGKFEALLVTGWYLKSLWQGIWAAKRLKIPVIVRGDSHLETPRSAPKRVTKELAFPIALRVFDVALFVGKRSLAYWQHYKFPSNRLIFSPHCVDNDWFASRATPKERQKVRATHGISQEDKVVLFAGKFLPLKRPLDLIHALKILRAAGTNAKLLTAGSGPLEQTLAIEARAVDVPLVQLGFRNQTEMPAVYASADTLVLPSDSETWGLVANEALASGLPIVVSNACGCAPDLAADPLTGRVYPVGDTGALAVSLKDILEHPPAHEAIAAKIARYSVSAAVDGVLSGMEVAVKRKTYA